MPKATLSASVDISVIFNASFLNVVSQQQLLRVDLEDRECISGGQIRKTAQETTHRRGERRTTVCTRRSAIITS
jgi:hypothetical protein